MRIPAKGQPPEAFDAEVEKWFAENTIHYTTCKTCGTPIENVTAYVSIHMAAFGDSHAGGGECRWIPIPYCPKCETKPTDKECYTCVHVGPVFEEPASG